MGLSITTHATQIGNPGKCDDAKNAKVAKNDKTEAFLRIRRASKKLCGAYASRIFTYLRDFRVM